MKNIIAVFNNRNQAMQFASYLRRLNVKNKTISTPRELSVSCGLSVLFSENNLVQAKFVMNSYKMTSFGGFYMVANEYLKKYDRVW